MRKSRFTGCFLISIVVVAAFILQTAWAQVANTGSVLGTVMDCTGAAVPGVSITLRNRENNLTYKTLTDEAGEFRFPTATAGSYELTAERDGFKKVVHSADHISKTGKWG